MEVTIMILESIEMEINNKAIQEHYDFIEKIQIDEIRMQEELNQIFQDLQIDEKEQLQMMKMCQKENMIEDEGFNMVDIYEQEVEDHNLEDYEQLDEKTKQQIIQNVQIYIESYQDQLNFTKQNQGFSNKNTPKYDNFQLNVNDRLNFNQNFLKQPDDKSAFDFPELNADSNLQHNKLDDLKQFTNKRKSK